VYERNKRYTDAEAALAKAEELSKEPGELEDVYFLSGAIYERQKKLDLAEEKFRKVLELNPESAIALNYPATCWPTPTSSCRSRSSC
jgi:tetratricopeptide (TPR) repeat protein